MEAFTQNNPSVCLSRDDLEAVQTMYPDCELTVITPVCYHVNLNLGFVRISVYVLVPLILVLGIVILMQAIIQHHNREELLEHKAEIKDRRKQAVKHKFQIGIAAFAAAGQEQSKAREQFAMKNKGKSSRFFRKAHHEENNPDAQSGAGAVSSHDALHSDHAQNDVVAYA